MYNKIIAKIKSTKWLSWLMQLLLIVMLYMGVRAWQHKDVVHGPAPIIDAEFTTGEAVNLQNYRGKPVLVHFWATWCPVCQFENDSVDAVADDYAVITIASWSDGKVAVTDFMQKNNLDMPVIVDADGEWAGLYGVSAVPASFFIDANGMIRFRETGFTSEAGLRLRLWWLDNQYTNFFIRNTALKPYSGSGTYRWRMCKLR